MMQLPFVVSSGFVFLSTLIAKGDAACSMTSPCVEELGQGKPFEEPVQLSSHSGNWSIKLDVDIGEVQYGWLKLKRRMYNGKVVGPTWNVQKGDHLQLTLNNLLSNFNNDLGKPPNTLQKPNTTNMHTHGLHISSESPQDNVGIHIEPGHTYIYQYRLNEMNPSGTLWYHAHVHTSTMFQVHSGLAGMLIVKDVRSTMPRQLEEASCPCNCDADIQMLFQPILQYENAFVGFGRLQDAMDDDPFFKLDKIMTDKNITLTQWLERNVNFITTNGLLQPVLTLQQHKMYRFRMVNAGGFDTLELFITAKGTNTSTNACKIREIAQDGIYFDSPKILHQGQSFLAPGNRVDWMVKCDEAGEYELRSYADKRNNMSTGQIERWSGLLVSIVVKLPPKKYSWYHSSPVKNILGFFRSKTHGLFSKKVYSVGSLSEFPSWLPKRPYFVKDLRQLEESQIEERFVMEFNTGLQLNRKRWSSVDDIRYAMTVGKVQEWHIVNTDNFDSHPFHPHINHFQVVSWNKYTGPFSIRFEFNYVLYNQENKKPCHYQREGLSVIPQEAVPGDALRYLGHDVRYREDKGNTLAYARVGVWRDTLLIPPLSNITIRFIPDRYTGICIIHCHILLHEDGGMIMATKIVNKGESLAANITSGNAYPGTCRMCDRYPFNNPKTLCETRQTAISNNTKKTTSTSGRFPTIFRVITSRRRRSRMRLSAFRRLLKDYLRAD